jgi:antimicrobial peptide system SdpA family protein
MNLTAIGKFYLFLCVFWTAIILYIFLASIPFNPLSLPFSKATQVYSLIPEGWGFFTRNPKEPNVLMYKKQGVTWINSTRSNSDPVFWFGLSRKNRTIMSESMTAINNIKDSLWVKRDGKINFNVSKIILIKSAFKKPLISGDYVVIRQDPIPWAWSKNYKKLHMPYQIIRIHIY